MIGAAVAGAGLVLMAVAGRTAVCVDVNGGLLAAECRREATRLESRGEICICRQGVRTEASVCPPGVAAPQESAAIAKARKQILRNRRTLVGAYYQGRFLCVAPGG